MERPIPPIGLAYLASTLDKNGFQVQVIDAVGESPSQNSLVAEYSGVYRLGLDFEEIVRRIPSSVGLIGLSCMFSQDWPIHRELINLIRDRFPNVLIIAGGEHITSSSKDVLEECPALDYCVSGEGEQILLDIANQHKSGLPLEDIQGIAFSKNGKLHFNPRRDRIKEINSIPWPAWDLLPMENYFKNKIAFGLDKGISMPLLASRGCPFQCTFCSSPQMWGTRWEARPPKELIEEIEFYMEKYNAVNFDFYDLTAIVRKDWIVEFCQLILDKNLNITWQIPVGTRAEAFDMESLQLLKNSGCAYIAFAPESGSDKMLKSIKKKVNLQKISEVIRMALKSGLIVKVHIVMGFPEENLWTCIKSWLLTIKLCLWGAHDVMTFNFSPFPGSELFSKLKEEGVITVDDAFYYGLTTQFGDVTQVRSYSKDISNRMLRFATFFNLFLAVTINYLARPYRLKNLMRSLILNKHTSRTGKALARIFHNRKKYNDLVSPPSNSL